MKRTLVIGDIHGGFKALIQLLERVKLTEDDQLIFLGDYVDGWSESSQIIDFLIELSKTQSCIFIKGNHDAWCQNWLTNGETNSIWLKHGGEATIASYQGFSEDKKHQHLEFFQEMLNYFVDDNNRLFIHAGFSSMHGPEKEHYSSNYSWDRTLWETAVSMDKKISKNSKLFPKRLLLFNEIYIGHTPTIDLGVSTPLKKANVWNVDTGAGFTGSLSALDIHSKLIWQSDPLPSLYPNEKGRN